MKLGIDRIGLLATFVRIADRGSITAAAEDLGMTQATASRQLKELERRLGAPLMNRTTHALALTEQGRAVLMDARTMLAEWQAFEERHSAGAELSGPLKVVAPVALGQMHLLNAALRFQSTHPSVALNWILRDEVLRFSEAGCDCWIKVGKVPDETLIVRRLARVERMPVAAPSVARRLSKSGAMALEDVPLIALTPFEGGRLKPDSRSTQSQAVRAEVALETNNVFVVKQAAIAGHGVAILPRWLISDDLQAGRLVPVAVPLSSTDLTLRIAYSPESRSVERISRFVESMIEAVPVIPGMQKVV